MEHSVLGFTIRSAQPRDAKAIRMLLGSPAEQFADLWVAVDSGRGTVVAAAGVTHSRRQTPLVGPGITVHVIAPCRRRGLGRALTNHLAHRAGANGAVALYAAQKVELGSEEWQALCALEFTSCETVQHHELPLDQFELQLAPLYERLRAKGRIPASARLVPLATANFDEVVRLHLAELGSDSQTLMRRLRGEAPDSFSARYSQVLVIDDQTVGFILAHRTDRTTATVDANVLAPEFRNGWANIWLKLEATRGALRLGITKFIFTSFDHYTDTRSFTQRFGGATSKTVALMHRPLGGSAAQAVAGEPPSDLAT